MLHLLRLSASRNYHNSSGIGPLARAHHFHFSEIKFVPLQENMIVPSGKTPNELPADYCFNPTLGTVRPCFKRPVIDCQADYSIAPSNSSRGTVANLVAESLIA
jgi:hypothetical protein